MAQPSTQEISGLAAIRQRLDAIGQAQRGETAGDASTTQGASGDERLRAAFAGGDGAALRHQALTTQAQHGVQVQTQIQAQTSAQSSVQPGSGQDFSALTSGDLFTAGRGGAEHASPVLMTAGTGTAPAGAPQAGQPLAAAPTTTLSAPLASSQWQQGLGQQLVAMQQQGNQRVELHLHPAELGPLSISLKVDDQLAQAQFASTNPQVRAAVEQAIPQLREALEECGIQLGEAMVGEHSQGKDDGNASSESRNGSAGLAGLGDSDGERETTLTSRPLMSTSSGVDLYA
jgi:flagellar hook-length control protein FliK